MKAPALSEYAQASASFLLRWLLLTASAALLPSCSPGSHVWNSIASSADRQVAAEAIDALRFGDDQKLVALSVPEVRSRIPQAARDMRRSLPPDRNPTVKLINAFYLKNARTGADRLTADFQVRGARDQDHLRVVITHRNGNPLVSALQAGSLTEPLEQRNALTFARAGPAQLLSLLLALLAVASVLGALATLVRASNLRLRWVWVLGCLCGLGRCSTDWTTGSVSFSPFFVQIFGGEIVRTGPVGPWIVSWSMPVVALIVLWRFRRPADGGNPHAS